MSLTSFWVRHTFGKGDRERDKDQTTPQGVVRRDNIQYGESKKWNVLDVYLPDNGQGISQRKSQGNSQTKLQEQIPETYPVIVSVHGGAWVYGDKEVYQHYCMSLAKQGFAVVNFTYRLAPEYKFPAALEDTNQVMEWIFANQQEFQLDTEHIFMVGDSAGAHILGLYTSICTNGEYAAQYEFCVPRKFVPKAVALNCGAYDVAQMMESWPQSRRLIRDLTGRKKNEEVIEKLLVQKHMTDSFPPVFLMTSTGDFLREQAPVMEKALQEHGIQYCFRLYGDEQNQLPHVFHCDMRKPEAAVCNQDECDFFRRFLN